MSSPPGPGSDSDSDSGSSSGSETQIRPPPDLSGGPYYNIYCERCRELEDVKPVIEDGDEERYLFESERAGYGEYWDDEGIKQRIIMYRKSLATTGGFDADCPPEYPTHTQHLYASQHFDHSDLFNEKVEKAVEHVIHTYNKEKDKNLKLGKILKVTASKYMLYILYITFECSNPPEHPSPEKYQAVVCCVVNADPDDDAKKILIFRKESTGMDLLDPHEQTARSIESWKARARVGDRGEKRKFESVPTVTM